MYGFENRERHLIVMTGQAGIRTLATVISLLSVGRRHGDHNKCYGHDDDCNPLHGNRPLTGLVELEFADTMHFLDV